MSNKLEIENARLMELCAEKSDRADELYSQIVELFEFVSGCEISEFNESQVPFLADMIQGQLEASDQCIESLRGVITEKEKVISELVEFVKLVAESTNLQNHAFAKEDAIELLDKLNKK